ncbi:uncharacterized protein LOC135119148 [Helicoverpa armigera]|uniref:uncharacterized protein LOC135119148 n=1 Tax=Helicoverpa armigera TaxID=29058 RepID=UPI0030831CB6
MNDNKDDDSLWSLNSEEIPSMCEQQVLNEVRLNNKEGSIQSGIQEQCARPTPEKRLREDGEENTDDDEGFTTVMRNPKRLNRSSSLNYNINRTTQMEDLTLENNYDVYVSSKECLPKQIGLAKLLRSENILGIMKINYKNPFRVRIQFENREYAEKLLSCKRMEDLGYRCQLAQEVNLSYGIVKNIELDVDEKELTELFTSEYDIVSVKRLKRFTEQGKWIDSETVRICFKGPTVPLTVEAYGCKFKVESYTFPVTQCSNCWRFGHLLRQCPTKRPVCPKCGEFHANCEATQYRCINCKGAHMSFDKTCPIFLKEKEIRRIMCAENTTYKKALDIYLKAEKNKEVYSKNDNGELGRRGIRLNISNDTNIVNDFKHAPSFRDVLVGEIEKSKSQDHDKEKPIQENGITIRKEKKKGERESGYRHMVIVEQNREEDHAICQNDENQESIPKKNSQGNYSFWQLMRRIKDTIFSNKEADEKIIEIVKLVLEYIKLSFVKIMQGGDWLNSIFKLFNG